SASTQAPNAGADPPNRTGCGVESKPALTWAAHGAGGVETSIVKRKDSSGRTTWHKPSLGPRNAEGTTDTLHRVCERPARMHTGCTPRTAGRRVPAVERKPM